MRSFISCRLFVPTILIVILTFTGCIPQKQLVYFDRKFDSVEVHKSPRAERIIAPYDQLYIKVISIDEKATRIFNDNATLWGQTQVDLVSYNVDSEGNINFPFVGKIYLKGFTTREASMRIESLLANYLPNTAVIVKFVNNQVTILGEVERQGTYTYTDEKINIYKALALAGGISRYGNRKKVVIVRETGGEIIYRYVDLTSKELASGDYYFLYPNDVIIVEPLRAKSTSYQNTTISTLLSAITTLIAVLYFAISVK
ncbi:MAG: polysaccharide export protein [Bacteroidales bacterium]|nr:polysaccharide export protein [Bacteroidales bacterium]